MGFLEVVYFFTIPAMALLEPGKFRRNLKTRLLGGIFSGIIFSWVLEERKTLKMAKVIVLPPITLDEISSLGLPDDIAIQEKFEEEGGGTRLVEMGSGNWNLMSTFLRRSFQLPVVYNVQSKNNIGGMTIEVPVWEVAAAFSLAGAQVSIYRDLKRRTKNEQ